MSFTVLSDEQVRSVLEDLTLDELDEFRHVLSSALHEFSKNPRAVAVEPYQQPQYATTLHPDSKATTLYIPCAGPEGIACKVISRTAPDIIKGESVKPIAPTGAVNLFSPDGQPVGLVQASTLTAFRTALGSACLLSRRNHVKTLTVFGSGSQAYWHIRLALKMRGSSIKHVNIINHRFSDTAASILRHLMGVPSNVRSQEGWANTKFAMLTPSFHDFERLQAENILNADVIYCCTPSTVELFDGEILTTHEGRKKGRLIVAVGSVKPNMKELPETILRQATKNHDKPHRHFHKHAEEGGVIVVDTIDGVLKEAGEIMTAGIGPTQLVELGELVMLHHLANDDSEISTVSSGASTTASERTSLSIDGRAMSTVYGDETRPKSPATSVSSDGQKKKFQLPFRKNSNSSSDQGEKKKEDALVRWLRDGTVIYKSVGIGLMDLSVGFHLLKVAGEKNLGTQIPNFT
ncbi:unnamed protein product [Clonostachys byssicola]|uniref:Ornithine cyclodeaminase n=1 Tax=Clonostachys byssicola TaxID=160290 RepID=A0A9N9Y7A8_9HYPO|nr:unnamed protein product [Clonostachys byssicola]